MDTPPVSSKVEGSLLVFVFCKVPGPNCKEADSEPKFYDTLLFNTASLHTKKRPHHKVRLCDLEAG